MGPSVIQVRGQDVLPDHMGPLLVAALRQHEADLAAGALVVVDDEKKPRANPAFLTWHATVADSKRRAEMIANGVPTGTTGHSRFQSARHENASSSW